jgi:two-component system cell cycle sensor histidine kinase/response regulator CckA
MADMSSRVLIAEDDDPSLMFLVQAVKDADTDVVAVTSGAELVAAMANGGVFDLVITDLMMPWMNGATVLRAMRSAGVKTPFLVVTGMDPASIERLLDQLDRVTVLRKPVLLPELRSVVRALLAGTRGVPSAG